MAKQTPLATTRYGKRKLSAQALAEQKEAKARTRGSTVYGNRKAGAKRPDRPVAPKADPNAPRLPEGNPAAGEVRARDGNTEPGARLKQQPPKQPPPNLGNANPFADASVKDVEAMLENGTGSLEQALNAELARSTPRKGVIQALEKAEQGRQDGARPVVLEALAQLQAKLDG